MAEKRKRGRPSQDLSTQVQIRLTEDERARLKAQADAEGRTVASHVRYLLRVAETARAAPTDHPDPGKKWIQLTDEELEARAYRMQLLERDEEGYSKLMSLGPWFLLHPKLISEFCDCINRVMALQFPDELPSLDRKRFQHPRVSTRSNR